MRLVGIPDFVRNAVKEAKRRELTPSQCLAELGLIKTSNCYSNVDEVLDKLKAIKGFLDKGLITEDEAAKRERNCSHRLSDRIKGA